MTSLKSRRVDANHIVLDSTKLLSSCHENLGPRCSTLLSDAVEWLRGGEFCVFFACTPRSLRKLGDRQHLIRTNGTYPTAGLLLVGSLTSQGANVSGTFRLANLALPNSCGTPLQQVVTVTGSIDSSRNLTLTSAAFSGSILKMQLAVPPTLSPVGAGPTLTALSGTIAITGGACTFASSTAFGVEIVSLTGTYSGTLTATFPGTQPIASGIASLALTQATTPQADGQFPVTGTLSFATSACTSSTSFSWTVSGFQLTLTSQPSGPLGVSPNNLVAIVSAPTGQLDIASLIYGVGPCNTSLLALEDFTGNLTKQ